MKQRQYKAEPAKPLAHRGIVEQATDGLRAIPRGIGSIPAGFLNFLSRVRAMAMDPQRGAENELQGELGWKRVALNFLGLFLVIFIFTTIILALSLLSNPKFDFIGYLPMAPLVALRFTIYNVPVQVLVALLTSAIIHLMARITGSKGAFERIAGVVALLWSVLFPLTIVSSIIFGLMHLPSLNMNDRFVFGAADLVMTIYLTYALGKIMTVIYHISFGRAVFMVVVYQLLIGVLGFVAAQNLPAAV